MTMPTDPTEAEVLRAISELLARPRSAAALAHYPTLRVQAANLRAAMQAAIEVGEQVITGWSERLSSSGERHAETTSDCKTFSRMRNKKNTLPALVESI